MLRIVAEQEHELAKAIALAFDLDLPILDRD